MGAERESYQNIDLKETGRRLKDMLLASGLTVQELQRRLHLSCPQPIYRWFRGQVLPSVDHLYMLSILLGVHMEELLVSKGPRFSQDMDVWNRESCRRMTDRVCEYFQRLHAA